MTNFMRLVGPDGVRAGVLVKGMANVPSHLEERYGRAQGGGGRWEYLRGELGYGAVTIDPLNSFNPEKVNYYCADSAF